MAATFAEGAFGGFVVFVTIALAIMGFHAVTERYGIGYAFAVFGLGFLTALVGGIAAVIWNL